METSNLDLSKIKALFRETNIQHSAEGKPAIFPDKVITQAPGFSPMVPARTRRRKYTPLQMEECVKLSRIVGTDVACKQYGVNKSTFYGYARDMKLAIGKSQKKRKTKPRKYTSEQLDRVVKQALVWFRNAPQANQSMRKCCLRAGHHFRINGNTAYDHYNRYRAEFQNGSR